MQQFDKNGDGKVSQKEIPLTNWQLKAFFMTMDKDKNGEITLQEIASMIKERQKQGGGRGLGFRRGGRRGQHADAPGSHKPAELKTR